MQQDRPNKKPLTVCATHGLRYDPELDAGCVLCRKMQTQQHSAAASGKKHWPFAFALLALLVAGGLLFRAVKNAREAATLASQAAARLPAPSPVDPIPSAAPQPTAAKPQPERDYEGVPPEVAGKVEDANIKNMYVAAAKGSGIAIQRLLAAGENINGVPNGEHTPLIAAIEHGQQNLALWMLDKGADANAKFPLSAAMKLKMPRVVRALLEHGADPHHMSTAKYGLTPLQISVDSGDVEIADALAAHGAKLDVLDEMQHSLLARAIASRSRRSIHMLQWVIDHLPSRSELEAPARLITNVNQVHVLPAIVYATNVFNTDHARLMILNGATYRGPVTGNYSLLTSAAQNCCDVAGREVDQRETIHMLVEMGVDAAAAIREMDANPIWNEYKPWAEEDFIRKSAAKPPAKTGLAFVDEGGNTHLHWAAALGEPTLIKRLIDREMDVQQISQGPGRLALTYDAGATPLQLAAAFGHADAVDALLAAGARASVVDTKGRSPKDVLCSKESARYEVDYSGEESKARCARVRASLLAAH